MLSSSSLASARHGDGHVLADDLVADLVDDFRDDGVHLARHDRRAGLHRGQADFVEAAARAGGHPAQVVADFRELHGGGFHRAAHQRELAGILRGLDEIVRQRHRDAADFGEVLGAKRGVAGRAVDAGADGGRAHVDREELLAHAREVADAVADHHGIRAELLAERHRHGVLVFRAAHLQHVGELLRLRLERGAAVRAARRACRAA